MDTIKENHNVAEEIREVTTIIVMARMKAQKALMTLKNNGSTEYESAIEELDNIIEGCYEIETNLGKTHLSVIVADTVCNVKL